jgi:hypothetical protein
MLHTFKPCCLCSGFPKIPVRTATYRRLGLWRAVAISSRGSAVLLASLYDLKMQAAILTSYFQPVMDVQYLADVLQDQASHTVTLDR